MTDIIGDSVYQKDLEKLDIECSEIHTINSSEQTSLAAVENKKRNIFEILWYGIEGVESKGITPILKEEQTDVSFWNTFFMWLSTTNGIAGLSTGFLAIYYGLSFSSIILIIVFFGFISCIPVCFFAVFNTGLRQLTLTRFYSGWFTTCYCFCVMNWFSSAGWCSIDSSAAAEALAAINQVSGHNIPQWAALLVLLIGSMTIVFFGYNVIHAYERFAWIATFIVYFAIIARLKITGFVKMGHDSPKRSENIGNTFGFISCIFGFSTAWATSAADFTTYIPKSVPKWKTFLAVFLGMYLGLLITNLLGAAICYAIINGPEEWQELYENNGFGAAVYAVLSPSSYAGGSQNAAMDGFAKFLTVILALSSISMTTGSCYSLSLNSAQIHPSLMKIPRHIWALIGSLVSFALSLAFAESHKFSSTFSNIMNMVGYYVSLYLGIFGCELYVFRKGKTDFFDVNDYDNFEKLPVGYASFGAMIIGIVGVFLGMNQSFWNGYVSRKISDVGGEIGWVFGLGFSFISYAILRPFEAKYNRKHRPDNYLT
ncbi:hypothetical protein QEN19_001604 [Hanseniaspora menglaensis]